MRILRECGEFFREYRRNFRTTGSVLPSSRFLARALASELSKPRQPAMILEVGPGTGSVTKEIIRNLLPEDHLDAVEINGHFVAMLERRLEQDSSLRCAREQVRLIQSDVRDMPGEEVYDFIVSGLPHNGFPVDLVHDIFRAYARLLKPGGVLHLFRVCLDSPDAGALRS